MQVSINIITIVIYLLLISYLLFRIYSIKRDLQEVYREASENLNTIYKLNCEIIRLNNKITELTIDSVKQT